jgi:hypothetical protein
MSDIEDLELFSIYQAIDEQRRILRKLEALHRRRDNLLQELKEQVQKIPIYTSEVPQAFEWRWAGSAPSTPHHRNSEK